MALGMVFLAALIAVPLAIGAWALGYVTLGEAVLLYLGSGFSVIAAGILSTALSYTVARVVARRRGPTRVRIDVTLANRN